MVFVITPDSVASEVCRIELDYATEASKCLVPIIACETPAGDDRAALAELNWLSFLDGTDFEAVVDRLVEILDTDIGRVHLHTRLLTHARAWETRDRDRSLLLRGAELKEAETWLADQTGRKPAATPAQAQLVLASRRATTCRQRGVGFVGVTVSVVMAVLATFALIQRQTAIHQRQTAIARVAELDSHRLVAIEVKLTAAPGVNSARHLIWLRDQLGERFVAGVVLHTGPRIFLLDDRIIAAPVAAIWS